MRRTGDIFRNVGQRFVRRRVLPDRVVCASERHQVSNDLEEVSDAADHRGTLSALTLGWGPPCHAPTVAPEKTTVPRCRRQG